MTRYTREELNKLLGISPELAELNRELLGVPTASEPSPVVGPAARRVSLLSEYDLQKSIIDECDVRANQDPVWGRIFAVPNGQYRAGERMEPGLRKGVLDLQWPLRRGGYVGLVMELKVGDNVLSPEQEDWLAWYAAEGWFTCVVYDDAAEAMRIFEWYYNGATE